MLKSIVGAAIGGALLLGGLGTSASATTNQNRTIDNQFTITVSCFRGPWTEVIWDRPNTVFIDSLMDVGYSFPEANAIGERVCRDPSTVDRPDIAAQVMHRIIADSPPQR